MGLNISGTGKPANRFKETLGRLTETLGMLSEANKKEIAREKAEEKSDDIGNEMVLMIEKMDLLIREFIPGIENHPDGKLREQLLKLALHIATARNLLAESKKIYADIKTRGFNIGNSK
jgi:hypothetical protein